MKVRFKRQENDEFCGPAVLQMILGAHGIHRTQKALAREANTPTNDPDRGTEVADLSRVLERYGIPMKAKEHCSLEELSAALQAGYLVLVVFTERVNEWGHYALVRKITGTHVHLFDPDEPRGGKPMSREEFQGRWTDPKHTKTHRFAAFIGDPAASRAIRPDALGTRQGPAL